MKRTILLRHSSHVRADDVCTEHRDTFDAHPGTRNARLAVTGYVNESTRLMAVHIKAGMDRKAATEQCRVCRQALRATARAVVRVGKLVQLPDTVMSTLSIAGSMSDVKLLARMQGLHDHVLPYQDAFEAAGLPPDVLPRLIEGIKALEAARSARAATVQDAAAAVKAIAENQRRASATILALEAVVPDTTPANREVVIRLKVARRVGPRKSDPAAKDPLPTTTRPDTNVSELSGARAFGLHTLSSVEGHDEHARVSDERHVHPLGDGDRRTSGDCRPALRGET